MKQHHFGLNLILAITLFVAVPVHAALYSTVNFQVETAVAKISTLTTTLSMRDGATSNLVLNLAYNPEKTGLLCASGSTLDDATVVCSGSQKDSNYSLTVLQAASATKITLKGSIQNQTVKATYKGPKGKLSASTLPIAIQADIGPIASSVTLNPSVDSKGKLGGSGAIASGYGVNQGEVAVSGKMNLKKKTLNWSIKNGADKLSFVGKELAGTWSGKLSGVIGPAKVAQSVSIPVALSTLSRFHGSVSAAENLSTDPLADVAVTVRSDLDGSGVIDDTESKTAMTDSDGKFDVQFETEVGRVVTVDFKRAGYSQTPKMFTSIAPASDVPISTALRPLENLTLTNDSAVTADNKLQLDKVPATVSSMNGRVFNPVNEASQFPGEFADSDGNMLISSVFSAIQAEDTQGNKISNLATTTELRMQVPAETWSTMRDLTPGNGQIDVPLYYYDEETGQWKRSTTDGWLEDEARAKLAETSLTSIKSGAYVGKLYAAGNISHLSYWNIDWPIDTHGCVSGRIVDNSGTPLVGAVVTAKGVNYSGSSAPLTTDASGQFCIDVMRSEAAGEDINDNGITGEQNQISLTVFYSGKYYKLGNYTVPAAAASCGTSGCLQLGDIELKSSQELELGFCSITGKVVYSGTYNGADPGLPSGSAMAGVMVVGLDISAEDSLMVCFQPGSGCNFISTSDAEGNFSLKIPILLGAEVFAYSMQEASNRIFSGQMSVDGCPVAPVTLQLDAYSY